MTKLSEEEKAAAKQRARERFLELGWDRRGPPMTKLEQVARALFDMASKDRPIYDRVSWEELGPTGREHFMGAARVAVEALRQPSEIMVRAAMALPGSQEPYAPWAPPMPDDCWISMIDAILSEKPE